MGKTQAACSWCRCFKGVRVGEVSAGALVQVNFTAGGPARQLLSTYSLLAQSELGFGSLHSIVYVFSYIFFHILFICLFIIDIFDK